MATVTIAFSKTVSQGLGEYKAKLKRAIRSFSRAPISVRETRTADKIFFTLTGEGIESEGPEGTNPAFTNVFRVPVGGFRPPEGVRGFPMQKPEGLVFRSRTYTRFSGKVIRRPGFVERAVGKIDRELAVSGKGVRIIKNLSPVGDAIHKVIMRGVKT